MRRADLREGCLHERRVVETVLSVTSLPRPPARRTLGASGRPGRPPWCSASVTACVSRYLSEVGTVAALDHPDRGKYYRRGVLSFRWVEHVSVLVPTCASVTGRRVWGRPVPVG